MIDETRTKESYEDECQEIRAELIRVVQAHPKLMISQIIGILEILKADMVERIPKTDT